MLGAMTEGTPDPAALRDLLECWVLDCAGALPEERERAAAAAARSLLPAADDWRVALHRHFDLPESFVNAARPPASPMPAARRSSKRSSRVPRGGRTIQNTAAEVQRVASISSEDIMLIAMWAGR